MNPIPLPVKLKPSNLRPVAYRILSKKHGLHVKSDALEVLTEYIGETYGSQWKSQESLNFIEEVAKYWKNKFQANKRLFVDGENLQLIINELTSKKSKKNNNNANNNNQTTSINNILNKKLQRTDTIVDLEITEEKNNEKKWKLNDYFFIKDFEELPIFKYDYLRKRYEPYLSPQIETPNESTLIKKFANEFNIKDSVNIQITRYYQGYHRLLRNESFHFNKELNPTSSTYFDELELLSESTELSRLRSINQEVKQIILIKNLLGRHGKQFLIFGILNKNIENEYILQDSSDSIVLDLTNTFPDEDFFYFEGCLVICDGIYINFGGKSKFVVNLIYHPKAENREDFFKNFGLIDFKSTNLDLITPKEFNDKNDFFKKLINDTKIYNDEDDNNSNKLDKFVFIGKNIHLDQLKTLDYLNKLFIEITSDLNNLPIAIIFPGSFISKAFEVSSISSLGDNSSMLYKNLFDSLAIILNKFPTLCNRTQFIFMSGYNDPWKSLVFQGSKSMAMPFNKLSKIFFSRLSKVVKILKIVTNPFKIYYLNEEITLMNDDVYERMIKNNIPFKYYDEKIQLLKQTFEDEEEKENIFIDNDEEIDEEKKIIKNLYSHKKSNLNSLKKNILKPSDSKAHRKDVLKIVNTLINQSHLSPFSTHIKPIVWKYDVLMSLNPLPTTLILFDSSISFFKETVNDVKVINVGKFINNDRKTANYVEYYPVTKLTDHKKIYI